MPRQQKSIPGLRGYVWQYSGGSKKGSRVAVDVLSGQTINQADVKRIQKARVYTSGKQQMHSTRYKDLDAALDFASRLPSGATVYIVGHGTVREEYPREDLAGNQAWLTLSTYQRPNRFSNPRVRAGVADAAREYFEPGGQEFEVHWS